MRSVGEEAAQLLFRTATLVEGPLDLLQHGVQGQTEAADLGLRLGRFHAAGQVARRDLAGRRRHVLERPQAALDQPPREHAQPGERGHGDQHFDQQQTPERLLHVGQRDGDDQCPARVLRGLHEHAETRAVAVFGAGRETGDRGLVGARKRRRQGWDRLLLRGVRVAAFGQHLARRIAQLAVGARRQLALARRALAERRACTLVAGAESAGDGYASVLELPVDPVDEERAQRNVGRRVGDQQRARHEGDHRERQTQPQGHRSAPNRERAAARVMAHSRGRRRL